VDGQHQPAAVLTQFSRPPDRIQREPVAVLARTTVDDLPHIQAAWPAFETLVGLRGRKMYAQVDPRAGTYTVCTPVRAGDDPDRLGLEVATLPGGWYARGRLKGGPPEAYGRIGPGMAELEGLVDVDETRPLVEFYRRHDVIDLWVPVACP
jgi:hypothetical protein